uniref:PEHE domain-containing protein n=1 Tax=Culex tarsalis TaxID=7177 RepID=A0A1Q3G0W4_CULTA
MGLARRSAANVIEGPDAVVEMAPALTEPLSQSKLSSSATSGASPRTGGVAEAGTSTSTADQQQQDQLSDQDQHQEVPSSGSAADSGTGTASTIPSESDLKEATNEDASVVDDIQNNNSGAAGSLLKIDPNSGKDLIELALEQLHRDATAAEPAAAAGEGGSGTIEETAEIPQAVIDQIAQAAAAAIGAGEEAVTASGGEPSSDLQQLDSQSSIISSSSTGAAMGLQKDYLKDNPDMEQMLGELASTSDMELLQVFKSLEGNPSGDGLCAELAGGLSLFNDVDVVNMYEEVAAVTTPPNKDRERLEMHAEIVKRQAQMQRKYDFLIRRLNKLQARYMGQHVSDEVAGLFEYSQRYWKKKDKEHAKGLSSTTISPTLLIPDIIPYQPPPPTTSSTTPSSEKLKPISANAMKTFAKRLEGIATTQCSTQTRRIYGNRYFQGTTGTPPELALSHAAFTATSSTIPKFEDLTIDQLEQSAGMLHAELKQVQHTIDSEATASSSGGESADEMVLYNNLNQQPLTIAKRAAWRWAKDRASVAARWTWLLAQISDLEYRIRQHNELHNKIKVNKGAVTLEDVPVQSVNGYRGTLPGNSKPLDDSYDATATANPNGAYDQTGGSCRTRPFHRNGFRKRKLLQTANLHTISKKAARPSTVKCGCAWPLHPCALCTGRQDPTAPRDLPDTMPASDRVALLDPCFHPVLSFPEDVSHSVHFEAIMRIPDWQNKMIRCSAKALSKSLSNRTSGRGGGVGDGGASPPGVGQPGFFSSGDEGAGGGSGGAAVGGGHKKYGPDGKRKYNKHNKLHGSQELANHKLKKSKSKRNLLLASGNNSSGGSNRKSAGYPPVGGQYGPPGGFGATPGGTSSNKYYKSSSSKYRKQSLSSTSVAGGVVTGGGYSGSRYGTGAMVGSGGYEYLDPMQQDGAGSNSSRSKNSSPTPNHHRNEKRSRISYDIDNIVIHGMAAANKVEILPYKEIATPKWRVVGDNEPEDPDGLDNSANSEHLLNTSQLTKTDSGNSSAGISLTPPAPPPAAASVPPTDVTRSVSEGHELIVVPAIDEEDISDETILVKHERALLDERKKFQTYMKFPWSRPRANRRTDSRAESSGANTPDPTSPAPPTPHAELESNTSPACPSTPLVQHDSLELSEMSVINALNQSLNKKERRRTVSTKIVVKDEFRRSSTPDIKEFVPPYESLQFPLADDLYEEMVRTMPSDHLQLVEDAIVKLTRPNRPNNNLLLANRSTSGLNLAPASSGLVANPLSSNLSTTSTTLSATEATDLDEPLDENEEELLRAKKLERQRIMERLLQNSDERRMFSVGGGGGVGGVREVLDDDDPMDDEETDTGESLFVEEDDPNDPEWYDRPGRGRT